MDHKLIFLLDIILLGLVILKQFKSIMSKNNEISLYLKNISLLVLGILFLAFPLVFTTSTTDYFVLPKQILLGAVVLIALILFGARMISDGAVILRRTPFDFPISLFAVFGLASALFAINRYDSLIAFIPLLFAIIGFFIITNLIKEKSTIIFTISLLITGAVITSIVGILSFFKIYILPFQFTHVQSFTTLGSILDQVIYLAILLPIAIYFALPILKVKDINKISEKEIGFSIASIVIAIGLFVSLYQLISTKPQNSGLPILPFETGFQTAFAAISQDAGRIAQGFFMGSGFGTYMTDFTRFKQASFNLNTTTWALTFFRSSSFVLELLATTGFLGIASFMFLILKALKEVKNSVSIKEDHVNSKNIISLSVVLAIITTFILPLSFTIQALFFLLLGVFAAMQGLSKHNRYPDVELQFVASEKGPIVTYPVSINPDGSFTQDSKAKRSGTNFLPIIFFLVFLAMSGFISWTGSRYVLSDVTFQNSLVAAASNNGLATYNDQVNAIRFFDKRDAYYRIYSQTNLAIANTLAANLSKESSPSAQAQQTIYTLIQQSINSARTATTIAPQNTLNWQNLASIYRSLIGFGQNAESFALLSMQQATILDPNNPQNYLNAGGIYFQLNQWEAAQRQFQIAINLKPDFANAYYNLGHALENKGDLQGALTQYQTVKSLVANDANSSKKMTDEIKALQAKIGAQAKTSGQNAQVQQNINQGGTQPDLEISKPSNQLPKQKQEVKIPGPETKLTPTPTGKSNLTPTPTPAGAQIPTQAPQATPQP